MNLTGLNKYNLKSCLDIGAHVGNFYRELNSACKIEKWLLIEANKECEGQLSTLGVPYKICLLSDTEKELIYYRNKHDKTCTGNSYYRELTHHYNDDNMIVEKILSATLESVVGDESYDLIKLDTQGSEIDIMKGGISVLRRAKVVVVETSIKPYNFDAPLQNDVLLFMKNNGFELVNVLAEVSHIHQQDLLFLNTK